MPKYNECEYNEDKNKVRTGLWEAAGRSIFHLYGVSKSDVGFCGDQAGYHQLHAGEMLSMAIDRIIELENKGE